MVRSGSFRNSGAAIVTKTKEPRVAAKVALALLETIRLRDHPDDMISGENIQSTLPRRLGVSNVVETQIRRHQEYVRQGQRIFTSDLTGLMELAMKRPDTLELFFDLGVRLAQMENYRRVWFLPRRARLAIARRRVERRLSKLFGRRVGGFISGPFAFEASATPFVQVDSSGEACQLVAGFCQRVLHDTVGNTAKVVEQSCETRGDPTCRWVMMED